MQPPGWAVPPEQNPVEVLELCLELCLELLSSGLAARPLHARGQQGESAAPALPPWAVLALRGFVPQLVVYLGAALEPLQSQNSASLVFPVCFSKGRRGCDWVLALSLCNLWIFFFFLFNGICPGLEFPAYQIPVRFVENQHQGRGRQRPS